MKCPFGYKCLECPMDGDCDYDLQDSELKSASLVIKTRKKVGDRREEGRKYYEKHHDEVLERARKYREKNRELLRQKQHLYYINHREEECAKARKRHAIKKGLVKPNEIGT